MIFYPWKRSGYITSDELGLIHIYYGEGVGKTSRAVGLAVRAAGANLQVVFVQFMKSGTSAEVEILKKIPNISYWCPGKHPFILSYGPTQVHYDHAEKSFQHIHEEIEKGVNLLICDEILDTIIFEISPAKKILDLIERCRTNKIELVLTGRYSPPEIAEQADYITQFVQIKHPYYKGARARKGIEY